MGSGSSGAGAGKATLTDVSFTTNVSTASESLFADLLQGATNAAAILSVQLPSGDTIEYRFTDIEVDSVNQSDDGSSATPNPLMDVKLTVGSVVVNSSSESGGSTQSPIPPGWNQVTNDPERGDRLPCLVSVSEPAQDDRPRRGHPACAFAAPARAPRRSEPKEV